MLNVNIEFSKGVLFVRLSGKITEEKSKNIEDNVLNILEKSGIKYLVFNINELDIEENISLFDKCNLQIEKSKGKMLIIGKEVMNFETASDELKAMKVMFAC